MKKVIVFTLFSLLGFGGFVVGPWGLELVGAACVESDVEACILIKKNGKVEVVAGPGKTLRKPKEIGKPPVPQTESPGPPKSKNVSDLPAPLKGKDEIKTAYKEHTITIYGDKTCMAFNGVYYCW
jgi:hypothetical protein